jgi:hypothetical protein
MKHGLYRLRDMRHISQTHSGHIEGLTLKFGVLLLYFLLIHHQCVVITTFPNTPHIKIALSQK